MIVGSEEYLKESAIKELGSSLMAGSSLELDSKTFHADSASVREILDDVSTLPFLSANRFVVIKGFEKLGREDRARIIAFLKTPPRNTYIVLESKDDSLAKEFEGVGAHLAIKRFCRMTGDETSSWIRREFERRGKKVAPDAVEALNELHGQNLMFLVREIEKLDTYAGGRGVITLGDVDEIGAGAIERSAFDLVRAIDAHDVKAAMGIVDELNSSGKRPFEVIGLLAWYLKRILRAKRLQTKGVKDIAIAKMLKITARQSGYFLKQVQSFSFDQIKDRMAWLLEADLNIKNSKFDPALILKIAVMRLCLGR